MAQFGQLGEIQKLWEAENGVLQLYGARIHVTKDPTPFTEHVLAIGTFVWSASHSAAAAAALSLSSETGRVFRTARSLSRAIRRRVR